jgi:acetolactate synthase-1/2/3 large subunit
MATRACDLLVDALQQEGVDRIFGVPGEENLDLLDALSRSEIKFVLTRHEQAAGFMAATYGRLTGRPGVCMATLGPGATNLMTAAAYANLGAMPMVMITGQKPMTDNQQGQFQLLDVIGMMQPVTKSARRIDAAGQIPSLVRQAFRTAASERPGAVHLELPEDIAREKTDAQPFPVSPIAPVHADDESIKQVADRLRCAERTLMVIGAAANRERVCRELRAFVDATQIRFVTTQMGKGVVAEDHPACLGTAALSSGDFVHRAIEAADVILNVGHDVVEKPPFVMDEDDAGRMVVHVSDHPAQIDPVYRPQLEVIGDLASSVNRLTNAIGNKLDGDVDLFAKVKQSLRQHIERDQADDRFPMLPQRLVADLRSLLSAEDIIALDNGIYKLWFARNYESLSPNSVLLDNALASMGAGLPSAMAAAMLHPDRKVVAVCGDGGFMMNSAEVETAVRMHLNLVVLILRDDALGMIRWKQQDLDYQDYGLSFSNPDFVRYAEAYGATGHRIESAAEFSETLARAFDQGGVHLVEVPVDYSENDRILNHEIQQLSSQL